MKLDVTRMGSVDVLKPAGALVEADAGTFVTALTQRLNSDHGRFVVCLSESPYMDSTALEGLLDTADAMREKNLRLRLAELTPTCREIIEVTGLTGNFMIFENVEDAVRSFM